MNNKVRARVVVAVAAVLALAGCAPASNPTSTITPSISGPGTKAALSNTQPTQVFHGDCNNVLTESEVSQLVGAPVALTADTLPATLPAELLGGMNCQWGNTDASPALTLWVVPEALAHDPGTTGQCRTNILGTCVFGVAANGYWFLVADLTAREGDYQSFADGLANTLTARANLQGPPVLPDVANGSWPVTVCEDLNGASSLSLVLGMPVATHPTQAPGSALGAIAAAANVYGCSWANASVPTSGFSVDFYPGAAWKFDMIAAAPSAVPVHVEYATAAVAATSRGAPSQLYVTKGINLMVVSSQSAEVSVEQFIPAAAAFLKALK